MIDNPFIEVAVQAGYYHGRVITWTLDPGFKAELPLTFTVQGSEDPKFTDITFEREAVDTFFAVDDSNVIQAFADNYLYRVKLQTGANEIFYSKSIFYDGGAEERHKYLMAQEIVRKELLRMERTGRPGAILKRKNYSPVDTESVDQISGVPITDNSTAFGTGIQGGYFLPLKLMFSREDHSDSLTMSESGDGVSQVKIIKVRLAGFPIVAPKDVLVMKDDSRWNLNNVQNRFFPGTDITIVQTADARAIPSTDPIYKIEVKF